MLSRVRSAASRGADAATLSLTAPLLKVRLLVTAGADADVAAEFAEMRLVLCRSKMLQKPMRGHVSEGGKPYLTGYRSVPPARCWKHGDWHKLSRCNSGAL
jgi:hypothetical protein